MLSLWQRAPVIVRAVVAGLAVSTLGIVPWGGFQGLDGLTGWNLRVAVGVPWAIVPMALYLWLFWKYLGGAGWPKSTAQTRRTSLRANRIAPEVWGMALFSGFLGLAALLPLTRLMGRLMVLPEEAQPIEAPPGMPFMTMLTLLIMASIIAGVVEEAAFRGYMQGPIERRHGLAAAILINGVVFGLLHYNHHPSDVLTMLPFYIAVAAVYGGLTWATDSILPAIALHAGGDVFSLTRLWITGQPDWQAAPQQTPLIWETGVDATFVRSAVFLLVFAAGAAIAYRALANTARHAPIATR